MQDISGSIEVDGKVYPFVFNLNVMEAIQTEYGTLDKWGELSDGTDGGEPNAKAVIFGFREMINEGLDIQAEKTGEDYKPLTARQVGRVVWAYGLAEATKKMNDAVTESTQSTAKNA